MPSLVRAHGLAREVAMESEDDLDPLSAIAPIGHPKVICDTVVIQSRSYAVWYSEDVSRGGFAIWFR